MRAARQLRCGRGACSVVALGAAAVVLSSAFGALPRAWADCTPALPQTSRLTAAENYWVLWIAENVLPALQQYLQNNGESELGADPCAGAGVGQQPDAAALAALATWWGLKEGTLDPTSYGGRPGFWGDEPVAESSCSMRRHTPRCDSLCDTLLRLTATCGQPASRASTRCKKYKKALRKSHATCFVDTNLSGPTDVCSEDPCFPSTPWQVGMAGVQVPDHGAGEIESVVRALRCASPDCTAAVVADAEMQVIDHAWRTWKGLGPDDPLSPDDQSAIDTILSDTTPGPLGAPVPGPLKRSWLLRDPVVGTILEARTVCSQCVNGEPASWCHRKCPPGKGSKSCKQSQDHKFAPDPEGAAAVRSDLAKFFSDYTAGTACPTTTVPSATTTTTLPAGCFDSFDCPGTEICCGGQCRANPYEGKSVCSTIYTPACTICTLPDGPECHCNGIFCDSCGDGSIAECVNLCQ